MWHCWCRFPFEKKMRWIFKRRHPRIRLAVYQSSNAILIYSEFMGFSRNGTEALMLMAAILPGLFFCAVYSWTPVSVKFYLYGNCSQKGWSLSGWLAQWLIRVKNSPVLGLVPFFWKPLHKPPQKFENRAMRAFWEKAFFVFSPYGPNADFRVKNAVFWP